MQLKKITDNLYQHESELVLMQVEFQQRESSEAWPMSYAWAVHIETRTGEYDQDTTSLHEATAFCVSFWRDLIGKEFE